MIKIKKSGVIMKEKRAHTNIFANKCSESITKTLEKDTKFTQRQQ